METGMTDRERAIVGLETLLKYIEAGADVLEMYRLVSRGFEDQHIIDELRVTVSVSKKIREAVEEDKFISTVKVLKPISADIFSRTEGQMVRIGGKFRFLTPPAHDFTVKTYSVVYGSQFISDNEMHHVNAEWLLCYNPEFVEVEYVNREDMRWMPSGVLGARENGADD